MGSKLSESLIPSLFAHLKLIKAANLSSNFEQLARLNHDYVQEQLLNKLEFFINELNSTKDWFSFVLIACEFINWIRESTDPKTRDQLWVMLGKTWDHLTQYRHLVTHIPDSKDAIETIFVEHANMQKPVDQKDQQAFVQIIKKLSADIQNYRRSPTIIVKPENKESTIESGEKSIQSRLQIAEWLIVSLKDVQLSKDANLLRKLDGVVCAIAEALGCITSEESIRLMMAQHLHPTAVITGANSAASASPALPSDFKLDESFIRDVQALRDYRNARMHNNHTIEDDALIDHLQFIQDSDTLNQLLNSKKIFNSLAVAGKKPASGKPPEAKNVTQKPAGKKPEFLRKLEQLIFFKTKDALKRANKEGIKLSDSFDPIQSRKNCFLG